MRQPVSRRAFLRLSAAAAAGISAAALQQQLGFLQVNPGIENPLAAYPKRDWERVYRDQYAYDDTFTVICAPNDTHMCRLRAFRRNGIVMRLEQNYDVGRYTGLDGKPASVHWNPRGCEKGFTIHRRIYGPHRLKAPVLRKGWKEWADAGFPSLSDKPSLRTKYRFDARGTDSFVQLSWDEANKYIAKALIAVARTYSGDDGRRRLVKQDGYPEEMLEHWDGAGTRTMKFGSALPLHGVTGKFGILRFGNMMGLLDAHVRGSSPDEARGTRIWSEYTWRGDQAPGHPFVHGLQGSESDMNDLRNSQLLIQVGKNLVENKMPESHWFQDLIERGGKIVTISPEYSPPATKSDYWIPVRAGLSDTSIFLGVAKQIIDSGRYDATFVKRFTDMPLLIRLDNLQRLRAADVFPGYRPGLRPDGPSFARHGLTADQYARLGDFVVMDQRGAMQALTREDVGDRLTARGIDPNLNYRGSVTLVDGRRVEVMTAFEMYRDHLRDYDLVTVADITGAPLDLLQQFADDLATLKPAAIHTGEGVNHYFHATLHNRATYLPLMLTGNIGQAGAGSHTWAGNYKGAMFQGGPGAGAGAGAYVAEDPFASSLDERLNGKSVKLRNTAEGEEVAYWGYGDRPFIVDTPAEGRKVFTGKSHMPSPTKVMWYNNANLINQAKWAYHLLKNVNPLVDMIVDQQIEWTGSAEYADVVLPANSWLEFQTVEAGGSCSNPFLQLWGGNGIKPVYDSRDDVAIFAGVAEALGKETKDRRFADYFKFALDGKPEVYIQRVLDASITTTGYRVNEIMDGKYGEPGAAMFMFRTYPRIPFWEQVHDSLPFYTDTGRLNSYCDLPEAIDYGENLVVHREAVEATQYLPNVIVSTSPYLRPKDYGIPLDDIDPGRRAVRNIMMPWAAVKRTQNPLWQQGYRFFCVTPKSRHSVHSSWAITDWQWIWGSNFGDPLREDRRLPGVSDWQILMNPQAAKDLGFDDGDYVYVDANAADRPYVGWKPDDPFYKVSRLMLRVKFSPGYPYDLTMIKHGNWMATERSVKAHETRPDGMALSKETGYQASFRYGSHQSLTRGWAPPMHQTDSLFHKRQNTMAFVFGFDEDNHAVNTTPKETLVRLVRAEAGGVGGKSAWGPGTTGMSPGGESAFMQRYLAGDLMRVPGA